MENEVFYSFLDYGGFEKCLTEDDVWREIVEIAQKYNASDIFFNRGMIFARIKGEVYLLCKNLSKDFYEKIMHRVIVSEEFEKEIYGSAGSADFAFNMSGRRFRANFYRDQMGISGVCRPLPEKAFNYYDIGITESVVNRVMSATRGLFLVTGPTGSGKSSTICSLIEELNIHKQYNIVTIEDPIEYQFKPKKSIISQREIGISVDSFATAMRAAMRQAPNVIFVGEMRDFETVITALQAAETGHVVFSTLHTQRVFATISRIIDIAPDARKDEVRATLACCLQMIIGQRLLPKKDGSGMVAAREIFVNTPASEAKIRGGKEKTISDNMISGKDLGMVEWDSCLKDLCRKGTISEDLYLMHRDVVA